jgi:hypothetical protein
LLFAMLIDMVRDLPFRSLSLEVGFLIDGPYNAFACAVCTSKTCGALVCD